MKEESYEKDISRASYGRYAFYGMRSVGGQLSSTE
jgi:hypothetical protein